MIALIDYGAGNIRSVSKALEAAGADVKVTQNADDVEIAEKVVLPGVGAFGHTIDALAEKKLIDPIKAFIKTGKPYLGICLGAQILFESSEENPGIKGLGILPGQVIRFPQGLKVPHLGWNQVLQEAADSKIWEDVPDKSFYYFAHSYHFAPENSKHILGTTEYRHKYASAVHCENVTGIQFHPEKSQKWGLKILENFVNL